MVFIVFPMENSKLLFGIYNEQSNSVLNYVILSVKQAGAELCQAQCKLRLVWLHIFTNLVWLGFADLANKFDFGYLILLHWKAWNDKFGLEGLNCFWKIFLFGF